EQDEATKWSGSQLSRRRMTGAHRRHHPTNRRVLVYAGGRLVSSAGDYMFGVALPALLLPYGRIDALGTCLAAYGVARACIIPLMGMLADRIHPRNILIAADAFRAAALTTFLAASTSSPPPIALLVPTCVALGLGGGSYQPASFVLPLLLVPEARLR